MTTDHQTYRENTALAASGQLETDELEALSAHCLTCAECRQEFGNFTQISARLFIAPKPEAMSSGERLDRFRARALREGLELRSETPFAWRPLLAVAIVIFAMGLALSLGLKHTTPALLVTLATSQLASDGAPIAATDRTQGAPHPENRPAMQSADSYKPRRLPALSRGPVHKRTAPVNIAYVHNLAAFPKVQHAFNFASMITSEAQCNQGFTISAKSCDGHADGRIWPMYLPQSFRFSSAPPLQVSPEIALPSVNLASMRLPSDLSSRHYDFSPDIRPLQFQIPPAR